MSYLNEYKEFLTKLNKDNTIINNSHYDELEDVGYTILNTDETYWEKNKLNFNIIEKEYDRLCKLEGTKGGWENRYKHDLPEPNAQRISNVPNKSEIFFKLVSLPDLLLGVNHVIKKPFKLSSMQLRNPVPYGNRQELHIDFRPRQFNYFNYNQCSCFIYLDDADIHNGALHIYPRTQKILGQPSQEHIKLNQLKPSIINVKKYNIVILNVYAWHYGGQNLNGKKRRTIFINFRERSEMQQLYQKKFLDKKRIEQMTNDQKYIFSVRDKDINQTDFIDKYRNNFLIKKYYKLRDIVYHKYLESLK